MNIKKIIITVITVIILAGGIGSVVYLKSQKKVVYYNDTYVSGNTPGNLCNSGQFCEKNDTVYFANPSDGNRLYAMDPLGNNVHKLNEDIPSSINADEHYLYYVRNNLASAAGTAYAFLHINTNSLVRCDLDGDNLIVLDDSPSLNAFLVGNYVYYVRYDSETASTFCRVKIDGTEQEQLAQIPFVPVSSNDRFLYFNGLQSDHNIYRMDSESKNSAPILQGNYWMPQVIGNFVYTMDCMANYSLLKLSLDGSTKQVLSNDRMDCFNAGETYVYFQKNDSKNPALCCIRNNGTEEQTIAGGNYTNINVTSRYVYYQTFVSDGTSATWYRLPLGGNASQVEIFTPPADAVK